MSVPVISVAMSVFNGERFLGEAIESILNQDFPDFEFIILDDGSTDRSVEIIASYAKQDHRIRPIFQANRGLIVSLNEILSLARAPLIARMDADDISAHDRLLKQYTFLQKHPEIGVLGSWSKDIDEFGTGIPQSSPNQPVSQNDFDRIMKAGGMLLCHPSVMYRRDLVLQVGGYHPAFRHCEDFDLWLRLASVTQLANLPEYLLRYRRYDGQVSSRHATEQKIGTAISQYAWQERCAGRVDPTAELDRLPAIAELDTLFAQTGVSRSVRARVALDLLYSATAMRGDGFQIVIDHLKDGGQRTGMWRTIARLLRFGEPQRALRLATTLLMTKAH